MPFTPTEREYLSSQQLGRLATVAPDGSPQNNPVGFRVRDDGTIDIGGYRMGQTRKWRNVKKNNKVALVVDDLVSTDPWTVRMLEIRGDAEAIEDSNPPFEGQSRQLIRVHPRRVFAFGFDPNGEGIAGRDF
jgi:pyridoxamine 5'-phosphate oxidase family protein